MNQKNLTPILENRDDLTFQNENKDNYSEDDICSLNIYVNGTTFNFQSFSPKWIWNKFIPHIVKISKHSDDKKYQWKKFTVELLRNLPTLHWSKVEEIINIAHKRYQHIHGIKLFKKEPRTVNIAILGGSVTKGVNCAAFPKHNVSSNFAIMKCNWYSRLKRMLSEIFGSKKGKGLFNIELIVLGGANTAVGTEGVKYNLLSQSNEEFDVIINAYSTNDVHFVSIKEAKDNNLTLEEYLFRMEQEFIRVSLGEGKPCKKKMSPLITLETNKS